MPDQRPRVIAWALAIAPTALALTTFTAEAAEDVARFEVALEITWSQETAPLEFPVGAHLSRLIGATHNRRYVLFRDGHTASSGLELVAENGRPKTLQAELDEAERRGRLGTVISGQGLSSAPGRIVAEFRTTRDHPLLSIVTMLAPSPDWFTGVADIVLANDNGWIDQAEVPLWAWDAGTDGGATYDAANADMQPQQSVRLLATPHFLTPDGLVPVGVVTIRRMSH